MRALDTSAGVDIAYTVQFDAVAQGFAGNAASAFTTLTSALSSAVTGGSFTQVLQTYAQNAGNTAMSAVTSDSVTPATAFIQITDAPTAAPTKAPTSPKKSTFTTVVIIGIAVGVGGAAILFIMLVFILCAKKSASVAVVPAQQGAPRGGAKAPQSSAVTNGRQQVVQLV